MTLQLCKGIYQENSSLTLGITFRLGIFLQVIGETFSKNSESKNKREESVFKEGLVWSCFCIFK
ncbi:MAG: hypothetical protein A3G38_04225 [Omnitrophica WOR_2 bacterium RIFCSPLOWO2_12_FULL_51_8]|nr:MAG: hypothetical protein A3G38_04225 [Omnitrophica WOR_2 bacterium RIFCSPLOWO2_12_FULL_51_8]